MVCCAEMFILSILQVIYIYMVKFTSFRNMFVATMVGTFRFLPESSNKVSTVSSGREHTPFALTPHAKKPCLLASRVERKIAFTEGLEGFAAKCRKLKTSIFTCK